MDLNEIKRFLGKDWERVGKLITSSLDSDIDYLNSINRHISGHSGKQLRPVLALLVARICSDGRLTDASCRFAAGSEMLHNATLLHDDVADNSDKRRGIPTVRSLMGPSVSVLVGDYWLVRAVDCILGVDENVGRVIRIFSKTLSDLAEGEMLQLQKSETCDTDEDDYLRIIFCKTASLFEAASVSAAISVGASEERENAAREYALSLGLAFQIRDDMLDYSFSSQCVGKPVGVDIMEGKITLPLLGAMSSCGGEKEADIRKKVSEIHGHPEYKDEIFSFVKEFRGMEYAEKRLEEYVCKAVEALEIFPPSQEKNYLEELAYFVGKRVS